ncbi:hypothetical protein HDF16_006223 [Granulicella aggregans]|uniref:Uncharacterized protein n=1 Tax=Granulicella aggregans TaxID=474949 RepID=A0A7W8E798_9BACT|nr:hypothetical protein [Granulicella aggregans]MBB5061487.1 hypothetical protein [Granulicella aggregans]
MDLIGSMAVYSLEQARGSMATGASTVTSIIVSIRDTDMLALCLATGIGLSIISNPTKHAMDKGMSARPAIAALANIELALRDAAVAITAVAIMAAVTAISHFGHLPLQKAMRREAGID